MSCTIEYARGRASSFSSDPLRRRGEFYFRTQGGCIKSLTHLLIITIFGLSLSFFQSCSKKADFKVENGVSYVSIEDPSVEGVRNIPWRVGKYGKDKVSRGFRLSFDLPILSDTAWEKLYNGSEVNGWLVRLRRKANLRNEIMGYYGVEMISPKPGSDNLYRVGTNKKASLGVYYAASSISMRLDTLPCPAFDHRLWLDNLEVTSRSVGNKLWVTSSADEKVISAKVNLISYSAITVNGGMSLKGEYYIDLALYNTNRKLKKSEFIELANHVTVGDEERVKVKGCENFTVPNKGDGNPVKKFKFGR